MLSLRLLKEEYMITIIRRDEHNYQYYLVNYKYMPNIWYEDLRWNGTEIRVYVGAICQLRFYELTEKKTWNKIAYK